MAHRHGAFAQCDTVYLMENGRPVPATVERRKAPVRPLQAVDGKKGAPVRPAAGRSPERSSAGGAGGAARQGRTYSIRDPAGGRDERVARAIARVSGSSENPSSTGEAGAASGRFGRDSAP